MPVCPYCQENLDENYQYNFCEHCYKQIRCTNCSNFLKPNTPLCLYCAHPIQVVLPPSSVSTQMNEVSLKERSKGDDYSRELKAKFSNELSANVLNMLGIGKVGGHPRASGSSNLPPLDRLLNDPGNPPPPSNMDQGEEASEPEDVSVKIEKPAEHSASTGTGDIAKLFGVEDGILIAKTSNFNGGHDKENQLRFMLLYVYAHEKLLDKPANRTAQRAEMQERKLFDKATTRNYFALLKKDYLYGDDKALKVNADGEEQSRLVLEAVLHPNDDNKSVFDVQPRKRYKKRTPTTSKEGKTNKEVEE